VIRQNQTVKNQQNFNKIIPKSYLKNKVSILVPFRQTLKQVGVRPLAQGVILRVIVSVLSLWLIFEGYIKFVIIFEMGNNVT